MERLSHLIEGFYASLMENQEDNKAGSGMEDGKILADALKFYENECNMPLSTLQA